MSQAFRFRTTRKPAVLVLLAALLAGTGSIAAQTGKEEKPALRAGADAKTGEKPRNPRLPNYYSKIVDDEQRARIGEIQRQYQPRIARLRAELAALIAQRDAECRAVLRPDQQKMVDELEAAAREKRRQAAALRRRGASGATVEATAPATESTAETDEADVKEAQEAEQPTGADEEGS